VKKKRKKKRNNIVIMSQLQKAVQTGIELASKAIAYDSNHQYQEAVQEYNAAIEVFGDVVRGKANNGAMAFSPHPHSFTFFLVRP
jgi:hypothetical protein